MLFSSHSAIKEMFNDKVSDFHTDNTSDQLLKSVPASLSGYDLSRNVEKQL